MPTTHTTRPNRCLSRLRTALKGGRGAIDASAVMVGVIVLGILALAVLTTTNVVIPWGQDAAAKANLVAVRTAQSDTQVNGGKYQNASQLEDKGYLSKRSSVTVVTGSAGDCFVATSTSDSGNRYWIDNTHPTPQLGSSSSSSSSACGRGSMVSTWDTSQPGCATIIIPVGGVLNGTVDWGDGTIIQPLTAGAQHTYAAGTGVATVKIAGTFAAWGGTSVWTPVCITTVTDMTDTGTMVMDQGFKGATNLVSVVAPPSTVTSMRELFSGASKFNQDLVNWNTSNITNMTNMFANATTFNGSIASFDMSKVTDTSGMFYGATAFNQPLNSWVTSSLTTANSMFYKASGFNQPVNNWDVTKLVDAAGMFQFANSYNRPLNEWNTASLSTVQNMFNGASAMNQTILNWNTSRIANATGFRTGSGFNVSQMASVLWGGALG